jgi:lactobin A/cerein 7B family class IIb bacteriocin
MKELTMDQINEVSGGALPLILLGDFVVGAAAGAVFKKLWNKYA